MNFNVFEHAYQCPYCFSEVSILLDPSVADQSFIEDCEVCCNPTEFIVRMQNGALILFDAQRMDN